MPAFTTDQWAVLFLVLVLGWLLGLMSRSGGGRYRQELADERARRIALEKDHDTRIAAANSRIVELERTAPLIGAGTAAGIGAAARGERDNLALVRGVGPEGETRLNDAGIHTYHDVAMLSPADEAMLEGRLTLKPGTIAREEWREQAALLADRKLDEHRSRWG